EIAPRATQSRHVAMSVPLAIAFVQVPPSKLGQLPGQLMSVGVIPAASHLPVILPVILVNAVAILPCVSQALIVPPGAFWLLPALTSASLHFWVILAIAFTYFVNSLLIVCRHLNCVSGVACATGANAVRATRVAAPTMAPRAVARMSAPP